MVSFGIFALAEGDIISENDHDYVLSFEVGQGDFVCVCVCARARALLLLLHAQPEAASCDDYYLGFRLAVCAHCHIFSRVHPPHSSNVHGENDFPPYDALARGRRYER